MKSLSLHLIILPFFFLLGIPGKAGLVGADVNMPEPTAGYYDSSVDRTRVFYAHELFNHPTTVATGSLVLNPSVPNGKIIMDPVAYWDDMMDQYESSQVDFLAIWLKGIGQWTCQPARFHELVSAINKRGLTDRLKVMPFDDNPASWCAEWNLDQGNGYNYTKSFDVGNQANWVYVWDKNLEVWFQNVPDANRLKINGRPVISFWSLSINPLSATQGGIFSNTQGNASRLITYIRQKCQAEFGFNPYIVVPEEWQVNDTTSLAPGVIDAVRPWFVPIAGIPAYSTWSLTNPAKRLNGVTMGCAVPSYGGPNNLTNDTPPRTLFIDPNHGQTIATGMQNTVNQSTLTFLEGFDDYWEAATVYRAENINPTTWATESYADELYDYPNQRINMVRTNGNVPFPTDLKEEAEGCDYFGGAVGRTDARNFYRNGPISIYPCSDTHGGYQVGPVLAGEWLEWEQVPIQDRVRLVVRVATTNATGRLHFVIDGVTEPTVNIPATGSLSTFATVDAGVYTFAANSHHTVRLVCDTSGFNINYWQLADSTVLPTGPVAYMDDFDDHVANGWTIYGGTWSAASGQNAVNSGSGYKSVALGTNFSDLTYEADIRLTTNGGNSGLIFRVSNPTTGTDAYRGYYAGISTGGVTFGRANNGWTQLASSPISLAANVSHHMKVVAVGSLIKIFVDNMSTAKLTVSDSTYTSGAIGVRAFYLASSFDNILVSYATIPSGSSSTFFRDDFSEGNADAWTVDDGNWSVSNAQYKVTSSTGNKSFGKESDFSDLTYETNITLGVEGGNAGVMFRVSASGAGADNYYGYYAGINTNGVIVGFADGTWHQLAFANSSLLANTPHHLKVVAVGSQIRVYVDDMTTPKATVSDSTYAFGAIGLRAFNVSTTFDNVVISNATMPSD